MWSLLATVLLAVAAPEPVSTRVTEHFRLNATAGAEGAADRLAAGADARFLRLRPPLGACAAVPERIDVWLAVDAERFAAAFHGPTPMAEWAVGVAFVRERRIVLRAHGSGLFTLSETFDHEISHILLHDLTRGRPVPLWFVEGLAIWQSGESVVQRLEAAHRAAATGRLISLADLDARFPERGVGVALAYAESGLFVRWLRQRSGALAFKQLFAALGRGIGFEGAFGEAFGASPDELAELWVTEMEATASSIALLRDGSFAWGAMVLLLLWVGVVRMRRRREALDAMGRMEEADDAWAEIEAMRGGGEEPTLH